MAKVKNGCTKEDNIAVSQNTGGAVVSDSTARTSSKQDTDTYGLGLYTHVNDFTNKMTGAVEKAAASLDATTRAINSVDCSDMLEAFLKEHVPLFATAANALNTATNFANGISSGVSVANLIQSPDFVKNICAFVEKWGTVVNGWLDITIKAAMALFNKIDAARERLEMATIDFTEAVRHCVLDVFNAIRDKIFTTLTFAIDIDWENLAHLMDRCKCICVMIANLTGCTEDEYGRDITQMPASVIACIKEKFSFLEPKNLCLAIDNMLTKYVKQYINMIFNYLESWIVYVFQMLIKPLRSFIRMYARLLRRKIDVDAFIRGLGPFKCLFVYSEESKGSSTYYGMSPIDMVNTYKGWIGCLQMACPQLSEKIKSRTKELYKELRLDDKYWRRAMEADIYTMCIATEMDSMTTRESVLRELYNESPWDLLMMMFKKTKNSDDDKSEDDEIAERIEIMSPIPNYTADQMVTGNVESSAISNAVNFTSAPETENEVNVGNNPITDREINLLKDIAGSLGAQADDSFMTETFYQLVRFGNQYATTRDYVEYMQKLLDTIESFSADFMDRQDGGGDSDGGRTPYYDGDVRDGSLVMNNVGVQPTYVVKNDFDRARSDRLSKAVFGKRLDGEPLDAYYARMYRAALA